MPNDQKVGFALGLLLLGIVGAFFFRNPPAGTADVPALESSAEVDKLISEKEVTPYLSGIETNNDVGPKSAGDGVADADDSSRREAPHWEVPDFLKKNTTADGRRYANPGKVAPNPIPLVSETDSRPPTTQASRTLKSIPEHNHAWEAVPPIPLPEATPSSTTERSLAKTVEMQKTHVVQTGDTLSGIAYKYLGSSARFLEVYEANRDMLKNPNDLRVGMKLKIPPRNSAEIESVPVDGPSAAASTRSSAPTTASRKPVTPSATRTPDAEDDTAERTADQPSTTTPRRRFAPVRRSPYLPGANSDQTSIDKPASVEVVKRTTEHKPGKKTLTQTPPADLPLDVEHQSE